MGEYLNGQKNGKVKEYGYDKVEFIGELKNGKRNGLGKEYYNNGNIKFEGEYSKGKIISGVGFDHNKYVILKIEKDGKGEEYFYDKSTKFKGEYLNGKKWNRKGKKYKDDNEFVVEVEYLNGRLIGKDKIDDIYSEFPF